MRIFKTIVGLIFWILIKIYQLFISPLSGATCKFTPTCSQYGADAIKKYGPFKGGYLTLKRLASCHPWNDKNGYDPVP